MKDEEKKEFLKEYKMSLISGRDPAVEPSAGEDRNTF